LRKPRIIIFDDDPVFLHLLEAYFSMKKFEVRSFGQPVLCICTADCCGDPCADIVITDFAMPGITGIEILAHQSLRKCPIDVKNKAVLSGKPPDECVDKMRGLAEAFFQKPFRMDELGEWAKECLRRADLSKPLGTYCV
jgi:DNA-binding NtrC family response regulator